MKYSLECDVNGKLTIENKIEVLKGSRTYILIPDKTGRLSSIKIVVEVTEPQKFKSRIEPGEGQVAAKIIIKRDRELYQEIIREFQELESVLS
jgi:hypothetical protein